MDHVQEKTELLRAIVKDRKISDLPKISQVALPSSPSLTRLNSVGFIFYLVQSGKIQYYFSELCFLKQPTLVLWADRDQIFPLELGHRLNRSVQPFQ